MKSARKVMKPKKNMKKRKRMKRKRMRIELYFKSNKMQEQALDSVSAQSKESETVVKEFSRNRLIAQNISWNCTFEDICALFDKHETMLDVELSMHNKIRNRGLAFVTMGSPEEALTALNNLESYELRGPHYKGQLCQGTKEEPSPSSRVQPKLVTFNLFVANLPFEARSKDLREFFSSEGGNVISAEVIFNENPRKSSGYGFVAFKSKKDADEALLAFQRKVIWLPLRVAWSKQFVKLRVEENVKFEDTSIESTSSAEQADATDEN
ncbi:hypothetical protein I3842_04G121400 [Carya illinoinensis]|uniref:RRM domain-containing protein n=1 Tax=Carya illinoinensis TaxID=32201 RepID=A0A922JRT0_CARIL|nr:hypothetical protein I3842_04G121400 [Carya illinoinensis]